MMRPMVGLVHLLFTDSLALRRCANMAGGRSRIFAAQARVKFRETGVGVCGGAIRERAIAPYGIGFLKKVIPAPLL
jgi:hypothetical protein